MKRDIRVQKRKGNLEPLDISKIRKQTKIAELYEDTSLSELEVDSHLQFYDGIKTEDIQQTLIKTAVDKISIRRPNWTFVASRLFLSDLWHKFGLVYGKDENEVTLKDVIDYGIKRKKYIRTLNIDYTEEQINELHNYMDFDRDHQFTYLGIKTLYDRYLVKEDNGYPIEMPQYMFMLIAMYLAGKEQDKMNWTKKFYDMISKFEVMMATPTLSNARTLRHQLSSCYVGSTPDNIEGIFDSYKEMALLSKYGGGIGWDWSKVRAMKGEIAGFKGVAGGVVPFLKIANDLAVAVDQLGTRAGSIAVFLPTWHLDLMDFLDLKKNSGEERRRTHDLFPALWIDDYFMECVELDKDWYLYDPHSVKQRYNIELDELQGNDLKRMLVKLANDDKILKEKFKAKEVWRKALTSYFESGNPFLAFKDTANRRNPNKHNGIIRSSNLCVTGDTKILTKEFGDIEINKVVNQSLTVWNGKEWSENVTITQTAIDYPNLYKVIISNFEDGRAVEIKATDYHKWYNSIGEEFRTKDLKKGMILESFMLPDGKIENKYVITYIEKLLLPEDTYCALEPKRNRLMFNGVLTGNCTEIYQNTEPNDYKYNLWFKGYETAPITLHENKIVSVIDQSDTLDGYEVLYTITVKELTGGEHILFNIEEKNVSFFGQVTCIEKTQGQNGKTAVCNLASVNLSKINTKKDFERIIPIAIRALDNVIDLNYYPTKKAERANKENRAIGLGMMGEAQMLADNKIMFGTKLHLEKINSICEMFSYNAIKASSDLAKEKGSYFGFKGSEWSKGIFPIDSSISLQEIDDRLSGKYVYNWEKLRKKVKADGMRNGYLMAIAPTSSISILVGTSQAIEPIYKRKWFEENKSGFIPVTAPNINPENINYYISAYDVEQKDIIKAGAVRQRWIDQGQSLNIFVKPQEVTGRYLSELYMLAWKLGLKSTYYLRSQSPEAEDKDEEDFDVIDRSYECAGCQ